MSEHSHQVAYFQWVTFQSNSDPRYLHIFAIPNGGHRHPTVAAKLKAEGVKAGVPDVFVAWPVKPFAGLWIEFKDGAKGRVRPTQETWLLRLARAGYATLLARSWDEARVGTVGYFAHAGEKDE